MLRENHVLVKVSERDISLSYHENYNSARNKMKEDLCDELEIDSFDEFDEDEFEAGISAHGAWCTTSNNYDWLIEKLPKQILKLTVDELERLYKAAKFNYKRNNASCIVLFHSDGNITQKSGYQECADYSFPLSATVCEI